MVFWRQKKRYTLYTYKLQHVYIGLSLRQRHDLLESNLSLHTLISSPTLCVLFVRMLVQTYQDKATLNNEATLFQFTEIFDTQGQVDVVYFGFHSAGQIKRLFY